MEVADSSERFFLTSHFHEWNQAGVTRMWLGARCSVGRYGKAEWISHSTGRPLDFADWAGGEPSEDCDGKPVWTWYECEQADDPRGAEYDEFTNPTFSCPAGEVVEIKSAFYGRASGEICSAQKGIVADSYYRM